jgi:hypothetical protein
MLVLIIIGSIVDVDGTEVVSVREVRSVDCSSRLSFIASLVSSLSNSMSQMEGPTEARYKKTEGQNL